MIGVELDVLKNKGFTGGERESRPSGRARKNKNDIGTKQKLYIVETIGRMFISLVFFPFVKFTTRGLCTGFSIFLLKIKRTPNRILLHIKYAVQTNTVTYRRIW